MTLKYDEDGKKIMLVHDMASTWDDMFVYSGKYADYALSMYRQWTLPCNFNGHTGINLFTMLYDQNTYSSSSSSSSTSNNTKLAHASTTIQYYIKDKYYNVNTFVNDDIGNVNKVGKTHYTPLLSHALVKQPVKSHTI